MTRYVITTDEAKVSVVGIIAQLPTPFEIDISDKRKRSLEQNALVHHWADEIVQQRDVNFDYVRAEMKLRFGVPILRRDIEAFRTTYDRVLKPLAYEDKIELIQYMDLPVTRIMSVKQLTEMLEAVELYYTQKGFRLSKSEDLLRH